MELVEGLGCCLALSPDGLSLTGQGEAPHQLLELIKQHRAVVIEWLEAEAQTWASHEASLAVGRITELSPRVKEVMTLQRQGPP